LNIGMLIVTGPDIPLTFPLNPGPVTFTGPFSFTGVLCGTIPGLQSVCGEHFFPSLTGSGIVSAEFNTFFPKPDFPLLVFTHATYTFFVPESSTISLVGIAIALMFVHRMRCRLSVRHVRTCLHDSTTRWRTAEDLRLQPSGSRVKVIPRPF
jgi:hypothetical protein